MKNYENIAAQFENMILSALTAQATGNFPLSHKITDKVIAKAGCELWEYIEASDIVRNKHNVPTYTEAQAKIAALKAENKNNGPRAGAGGVNEKTAAIEGKILARQEMIESDIAAN